MTPPELFAWKFIVPADKWYVYETQPNGTELSIKGASVVVVAGDEVTARVIVTRYMAENGYDIAWLKIARVCQIPLIDGAVLAYSEV